MPMPEIRTYSKNWVTFEVVAILPLKEAGFHPQNQSQSTSPPPREYSHLQASEYKLMALFTKVMVIQQLSTSISFPT